MRHSGVILPSLPINSSVKDTISSTGSLSSKVLIRIPPKEPSGALDFDDNARQEIVQEALLDLMSPSDLASKYKISAYSIRDWAKKNGKVLPRNWRRASKSWGPRQFNVEQH